MNDEKMTKEERDIAERCVVDAMKAVVILKRIHDDIEKLTIEYGWDLEPWDISRAAMLVGKEALGIAHGIGFEDGWAKADVMP